MLNGLLMEINSLMLQKLTFNFDDFHRIVRYSCETLGGLSL